MNNILYFQHYFSFTFVHIDILQALSRREQGFDSPWDYQTETRALRGFLFWEDQGESKSLNRWQVGPLQVPLDVAPEGSGPCQRFVRPERHSGGVAAGVMRRKSR